GETAARLGATTIGVRPEHLLIRDDGVWAGTVIHAEHLGPDTMYYLETEAYGTLTIRTDGDTWHEVGANLRVGPMEAKIHRFGADGKTLG
ncbi:MAG: TOBE domain-containing protein, partial [Ancalomicrobiaceae bacterium]|nr:TOBE domain-containing protein [Ancalomicrobiaceae bacterium]